MTRSRLLILGLVFAMFAGACGAGDEPAGSGSSTQPDAPAEQGSATPATPATPPEDSSSGSVDDPPAAGSDGEAPDETATRPPIEGPAAPDFTLALGDGSTFVMSEVSKPVYLVFWAEW